METLQLLLTLALLVSFIVGNQGYRYLGCYNDQWSPAQDLTGKQNNDASLTTQRCADFCKDFQYFATTHGTWCICGNSFGRYGVSTHDQCNQPCAGNPKEMCGRDSKDGHVTYRNSIYSVANSAPYHLGCFNDQWQPAQDLNGIQYSDAALTAAKCSEFCKNYPYFALTYGTYCLCGYSYGRYGASTPDQCDLPCSGDSNQRCGRKSLDGSTYRQNVFGQVAPEQTAQALGTPSTNYRLIGCFIDKWSPAQDLSGKQYEDKALTTQKCADFCKDYQYFATTHGTFCLCGNSYGRYGISTMDQCDQPCAGDPKSFCGRDSKDGHVTYRNSVYSKNGYSEAGFGPYHIGCFNDQWSPAQDLNAIQYSDPALTARKCAAFCRNYPYFSLTYGTYCLCGNSYGRYGASTPEQCDLPCSGDSSQKCGRKTVDGTTYRQNIYANYARYSTPAPAPAPEPAPQPAPEPGDMP